MSRKYIMLILSLAFAGIASNAGGKGLHGLVRDDSGKPVAGVVMSDGFSCVRTGEDGRWSIDSVSTQAMYVTCSYPETSVIPTVNGRPCVYLPIKKGKWSYNFVLERQEKETDFTMLCVGDPQVSETNGGVDRFTSETLPDLKNFVGEAGGRPVYIFTMGDHVHNEWRTLPEMYDLLGTSHTGAPCFSVIGNHDHQPKDTDYEARMSYQQVMGPVNYSINRGDVHIVVMDNILFKDGKMKETFSEEDYKWLRQDVGFVDKSKCLILLTHGTMSLKGAPQLYDILSGFAEARLVSGHSHSVYHDIYEVGGKEIHRDVVGTANGVDWAGTICGDGAPMGYAVYEMSGAHVANQYYKPVNLDKSFQIRMYRSSDFPSLTRPLKDNKYRTFDWDRTPGSIILNIWNYNSKWKLSVYEDGRLSPVEPVLDNDMNDMWACTYFYVNKNRWTGSYCQRRKHLFKFVPRNPNASIRVEVEDEYGNVYVQDSFTVTVDSAGTYDGSLPPAVRPHPYLFLDEDGMEIVKARVAARDEAVSLLHARCMEMADSSLSMPELRFRLDISGKRLLHVSRQALKQISSCAYAWRFTAERRYLERAVSDLRSVCSFDSWNPSHFLDVAEMATAVAVGYDWLYNDLPEDLKAKIEAVIPEYVFKPALAPHPYFDYFHNWNQVCNSGTVIAALALYQKDDPFLQSFVDKAMISNRKVQKLYAPDGVYAEGPVYWIFGTFYEILLIAALNDVFGTDYALYEQKGFSKSPEFIKFASSGGFGQAFNFSDNLAEEEVYAPMWYFAWREHNPSYVDREIKLLREGRYFSKEAERFIPMLMRYAADIDWSAKGEKQPDFFFGDSRNPVIMVHTGGKYTRRDRFLGIKGGYAAVSHGHMDAGEFVYDAFGCRWSMDIPRQNYEDLEVAMKEVGGNVWDMTQNSTRWGIMRYNNLFHSTITINGADHCVTGRAEFTEKFNDSKAKGGTLDLSPVFEGEAASVKRTVKLIRGRFLEITDVVTALPGKDADVHWNLATPADVKVCNDRIKLRQQRRRMCLKTVTDGLSVSYSEWPVDPRAYGRSIADYELKASGARLCGFESTVPAGTTAVFTTTLK